MKVMSRDFTRMEKILIGFLIILLLGLVYYYLVDLQVRDALASYEADAAEYQKELDALQANLARLESVRKAMGELEASGKMSWMGSYNNSKEEVTFLNDILATTLSYSISFSNVTRSGDQIRRSFTLSYVTPDYEAAKVIIEKLVTGKNRCVVGDLRCSVGKDGRVSMSQSATFYETMVGGVPDAALPVSNANVNR